MEILVILVMIGSLWSITNRLEKLTGRVVERLDHQNEQLNSIHKLLREQDAHANKAGSKRSIPVKKEQSNSNLNFVEHKGRNHKRPVIKWTNSV